MIIVQDIIGEMLQNLFIFLKNSQNFFDVSIHERKVLLEKEGSVLPGVFQKYILEIRDQEQFLEDIQHVVQWFKIPTSIPDNCSFFVSFRQYILKDIGKIMDALPMSFYMLSFEKRYTLLKGRNLISTILQNKLSTFTYQEIVDDILLFLKQYSESMTYIVVQSSRECSFELKQHIRKYFIEKYVSTFPVFSISSFLYGGIKIFVNGVIIDYSWLAKVERITRLSLNHTS